MIRPNQHVAIAGLAAHPVNGVIKFSNTRSWAVWIPGPLFDDGWDSGFFCYCPESTLTVLDLPDHVWIDRQGQDFPGTCEHCPTGVQPVRVRFPIGIPALTSYAVHERYKAALEIVNAVELQAIDYRAAYRLPNDHRFSVTFPPNEEIGRDVFELAETALNHRGIDVDWRLWPPKQ